MHCKTWLCRTVAVPAALGLRGCELFAEFAVSYRHGGASRAGAASSRASVRDSHAPPRPLLYKRRRRGCHWAWPACRPPADRRRPFSGYFGRAWIIAQYYPHQPAPAHISLVLATFKAYAILQPSERTSSNEYLYYYFTTTLHQPVPYELILFGFKNRISQRAHLVIAYIYFLSSLLIRI